MFCWQSVPTIFNAKNSEMKKKIFMKISLPTAMAFYFYHYCTNVKR